MCVWCAWWGVRAGGARVESGVKECAPLFSEGVGSSPVPAARAQSAGERGGGGF